MAELKGVIDLKCLESELKQAIDSDKLYWLQNNAKIRAVTDQKVATYEEFVDRVAAAHLRPLEKTDKIKADSIKAVWNPNCSRKCIIEVDRSDNMMPEQESARGLNRLQDKLQHLETAEKKYSLLKITGAPEILKSFKKEIPVGTFGDLIDALLVFPVTTADVLFVVSVLDVLTQTERFRLSLEFLTCLEKDRLRMLLDKVSKSLPNRHQDLAEENVTEWTVEKLREKFLSPEKKAKEIPATFSTDSDEEAEDE